MECLFCRHLESAAHRSEDLLFEDDRVFAFLHEDWSVLGHAVVVWKGHVENLSDLSPTELDQFMDAYRPIEQALLRGAEAERAVVFKLGLMVPHLHLHIYPFSSAADRLQVMAAIDGRKQRDINPLERQMFRQRVCALIQAG